jgi:uncharacterized membrane protein
MLKIYITISIIAFILLVLADIKVKLNKNTRACIKKLAVEKRSFVKNILSWLEQVVICFIPVINLFYIGVLIYLLIFASEYTLIKMLKEQKIKNDNEQKKIERLLNED